MLRPTSSLKEFMELVPVCEYTANLDAVLAIFSSGEYDRLVVVSQQQSPLGLVHLRRLMPYLIRQEQEESKKIPIPLKDSVSSVARRYSNIVSDDKGFSLDSFIEPLTLLSADLSLSQFWSQLQNQQPSSSKEQPWALVDAEGRFLGVLNSWRLLQDVATTVDMTASGEVVEAPSPQKMQVSQEATRSLLEPLMQLLEPLPLPLRLQTETGQVVSQNLSWRQQVGMSSMLDGRGERKGSELETFTDRMPESFAFEDFFYLRCDLFEHAEEAPYSWSAPISVDSNVVESNVMVSVPIAIKAQSMPASCTIFIPATEQLKRGSDRVWQFAKIPLPEMGSWGQDGMISTPLWLVLATDITDQEQVAKELAAKNADLVQLNRLKDEFLACISHELKTPLTAVLGLSSLLKDQILGELNERQSRYAQLIHQSGRQLMTVVNDILDLTRMETGQLDLTLDAVNIHTVCDRAYSQAQQLQLTKDDPEEADILQTRFTLDIEPSLEMLVADELRLRQMLVHLLSNALKFTDTGGEIGLKVSRWEGWIAFTVWDSGIGIPPEKQHLIFQKFQQLENPLTRRFEGTGLGLVLTQRLARLHGGEISFISTEGQGSQFTLLLPPCPPLEARGNEQFPRLSQNSLVLIVEATPDYIEALTEQLTSLGYRVVIARSGTEAIEKSRRLQPCAVLLNPLLPLLSGWDVLTLLKSDNQTCHIPVLVMGTWAEKEQAAQNQADSFLTLPVEESALQQALIHVTPQQSSNNNPLMILRLTPSQAKDIEELSLTVLSHGEEFSPDEEFSLLWPHAELNYRVVEADDLDQAELLARVWHPDVVLLESRDLDDPLTYLKQLTQHTHLASLPLVTLDHQTTEAANQVTELSVFPCLATPQKHKTAALLQAIQVAVGMCWNPSILVVDIASLSDLSIPAYPTLTHVEEFRILNSESGISPHSTLYPTLTYEKDYAQVGIGKAALDEQNLYQVQEGITSQPYTPHSQVEWLQALIQYLQAAGFRSILSHSWTEISRHLQHQNVDLLVIYIGELQPERQLVQVLTLLAQQSAKPPILVLDHRLEEWVTDDTDGEKVLSTVANHILRGTSQSMAELLDLITQMLVRKSS